MKIKENYAAIERTVALVKEKFGADSKIAVMFEKCISNTLFIVCKGRTGTCGTGMRADQKTNAVHSFRSICQCI